MTNYLAKFRLGYGEFSIFLNQVLQLEMLTESKTQ